jgi:integrase
VPRKKSKPRPYAERRGDGDFPWRVRWPLPPDENGIVKWRSASGFATEDDALAHGWAQMTDISRGVWVDERKAGVPFGEVATAWLRENPKSPKTDEGRRYLLRTVIGPRWRHVPIGEINWYEVKTWANNLSLPKDTVDRSVTFMSTILTAAVDAKMIGANPLAGRRRNANNVKNPINLAPKPIAWPQPEQGAAVAARMGAAEGVMSILQQYAGPRWGELAAVHREDSFAERTDMVGGRPWKRRVLLIPEEDGALQDAEVVIRDKDGNETLGRIHELGSPKTAAAVREVDLPPFLCALLDAHHAVWPWPYTFAAPNGKLRWLSSYNDQLAHAGDGWPESPRRRGTAGKPAAPPILSGLSSHGLRHAHATWIEEDGISTILIDAIMGHSPKGMKGVYRHPTPAMRKARVDALQARWDRPGVHDAYHAGASAYALPRRRVEGLWIGLGPDGVARPDAPRSAKIIPIPLPKRPSLLEQGESKAM